MRQHSTWVRGSLFVIGLCVSFGVARVASGHAPGDGPAPGTEPCLHLSLDRIAGGQARLRLDLPVEEASLRRLINGEGRPVAVSLTVSRDMTAEEIVFVAKMLVALELPLRQLCITP